MKASRIGFLPFLACGLHLLIQDGGTHGSGWQDGGRDEEETKGTLHLSQQMSLKAATCHFCLHSIGQNLDTQPH